MADWTAELLAPPTQSGWFARRSAPTKLLTALALAGWVILVDQPIALALPVVLVAIVALGEGLRPVQQRALLLSGALVLWGVMLSQGLFYQAVPREALVTIIPPFEWGAQEFEGVRLYREGLLYGFAQSLRFLSLLWLSLLISFTTPFHLLLGAMQRLRIPGALGLLTLIALRSLPTLAREVLEVRRAMRLRRVRFAQIGLAGLLRPLIDRTLWRAHTLAASLQLRGIDPLSPRLGPLPSVQAREVVGLTCLALLVATAAAMRILMVLYWRGWWFAPDWSLVYRIAGWLNSPIAY